jgi:hypothetical protein
VLSLRVNDYDMAFAERGSGLVSATNADTAWALVRGESWRALTSETFAGASRASNHYHRKAFKGEVLACCDVTDGGSNPG